MLAIALCFALFLYWWVLGYAVVRAWHATRSRLQDVLLAAPVGVVVVTLAVFLLNRLGIPVWRFGAVLGVALLAGASLVLWRTVARDRKALSYEHSTVQLRARGLWRSVVPFAVVLVFAFVASGRPLWTFGFDWLSFCNDDMANYCLAADRFYVQGYYDFPVPDHILKGTFWADDFWFMHVLAGQRPGCELLLSWVMAMTGLNAHHAFMPAIVAMHLALVATVGAMALHPWDRRRPRMGVLPSIEDAGADDDKNYLPALAAAAMTAASSMTTLGLLYQLIAQVLGLSLLAVMVVLVLRPFDGLSGRALLCHGLLVAVVGAGLLVIYPEVCPFLGLAFFAYVGISAVRRRLSAKGMLVVTGVGAVAAVVLVQAQAWHAIKFMLMQSGAASVDAANSGPQNTLFPYFMVPKGLSDFWGVTRVGGWEVMPALLDASIVVGAATVAFMYAATAYLAWRGRPYAAVSLIMLALGATMFRARAGFGLFKIAMYAQPFVIPVLVTAWFLVVRWAAARFARWRTGRAADDRLPAGRLVLAMQLVPLVLLAGVGMRSQAAYVKSSYGIGTSFLAVVDPSRTRVAAEFRDLVARDPADVIVSDTFNLVIGKFQALYAGGRELVFPSNLYFRQIVNYQLRPDLGTHLSPEVRQRVKQLQDARWAQTDRMYFDAKDPQRPGELNNFFQHERGYGRPFEKSMSKDGKGPLLVMTTGRQGVLNRRYFPETMPGNYVPMPLADASNLLVFVASEFAQPYFVTEASNREPGLYQLEEEPDGTPFFAGTTMCAVGRYMLVQVVNPTDTVRLSIAMTSSYQANGQNHLPPKLAAIGDERVPFPVAGRGSARLFSPPVKPQYIAGRPYLMYDMGSDGERFPAPRTGLMKWFGNDVAIDRRVLVGYVRDISVVSEEAYRSLKAPARLVNFTRGPENSLRDVQVEYSGLYEDGYASEDSYVRLTQEPGTPDVVIRGKIPQIGPDADKKTRVTVSIDGEVVAETVLPVDEFTIRAPVPPAADGKPALRMIRLKFAEPAKSLSADDRRPASALLRTIGFEKAEAKRPTPATKPAK